MVPATGAGGYGVYSAAKYDVLPPVQPVEQIRQLALQDLARRQPRLAGRLLHQRGHRLSPGLAGLGHEPDLPVGERAQRKTTMKTHSENLFPRALMLSVALGACAPDQPAVKSETAQPAALSDQAALVSRDLPPGDDRSRAGRGAGAAGGGPARAGAPADPAHPHHPDPGLRRRAPAGRRRGQRRARGRGAGARSARDAGAGGVPRAGERVVRVEARQRQNGKVVAIDRQEVPITVVDCPTRPLVDLLSQPGENRRHRRRPGDARAGSGGRRARRGATAGGAALPLRLRRRRGGRQRSAGGEPSLRFWPGSAGRPPTCR